MRACLQWIAALLLIFLAFTNLVAHDLGVLRVELKEESNFRYSLLIKLPPRPGAEVDRPLLPDGFHFVEIPLVAQKRSFTVIHYEFRSKDRSLSAGDVLRLPWKEGGAFVQAQWMDGSTRSQFFESNEDGIAIPIRFLNADVQTPMVTAKHYVVLGIEHILTGWDHLAFVLALFLTARGSQLIKLVSGFTIGHSFTLALAVLGLVRIPGPPVEACIALSIAFVARQALVKDHASSHGMGLVFAFGLLHGLGFAGALVESGIEKGSLVLGLFSFNLGVEVGQLFFVLVVMIISVIGRQFVNGNRWRRVTASVLGTVGLYWTLVRVAGFLP